MTTRRTIVRSTASLAVGALALCVSQAFAAPVFYSTTHADNAYTNWQVATNLPNNDTDGTNVDGAYSSFPTTGFAQAAARSTAVNWIANIASGSNGTSVRQWTFFVFRQTFDLTGYDASTAVLKFRWGADDTGEVFADRGSWTPKYSLNTTAESALVDGTAGYYQLGSEVTVTGFQPGFNTLYFFVEGNGITDGMTLQTSSFTASAIDGQIPEPKTYALLGVGLALMGWAALGRKS
jgi:hypothetical protein